MYYNGGNLHETVTMTLAWSQINETLSDDHFTQQHASAFSGRFELPRGPQVVSAREHLFSRIVRDRLPYAGQTPFRKSSITGWMGSNIVVTVGVASLTRVFCRPSSFLR